MAKDTRLIDYLPPILRDVLEFQAINDTNGTEISAAWADLERLLNNQFLDIADVMGVEMWEQELGLTPKSTDTLTARKERIKVLRNSARTYTLAWLRQQCKAIAAGAKYSVEVKDYTLKISTEWEQEGQVESLQNILSYAIPANMVVEYENTIKCASETGLKVAHATVPCTVLTLHELHSLDVRCEGASCVATGTVLCDIIQLSEKE